MPTMYAKLNTAITIPFGPVLDSSGAEYTTLVVGEVKISKNNGTPAALNGSATLTHKEFGVYELALTTSDISQVGNLVITCSKTTYVAPPVNLIVFSTNTYDSLINGTDYIDVNAVQWIGQTIPTPITSGLPQVDMLAISGDMISADRLRLSTLNICFGVVSSGTPTTIWPETIVPTAQDTDQFKGRILIFPQNTTTTELRGEATNITASNSTSLTFSSLSRTPASGDFFTLM